MLKCAILGAKGFTGQELGRILSKHPEVEISFLFTQDEQAIKLGEIAPELADLNLTIEHHEVDVMAKGSDVVFLALPHTISMNYAKEFLDQGCVVIDLSADFRFKDAATYEVYYKVSHTNQQLLEHSIYALPELFASEIKDCDLIANPGCYPTSVVLPIAPLLKEDRTILVVAHSSSLRGLTRVIEGLDDAASEAFRIPTALPDKPERQYRGTMLKARFGELARAYAQVGPHGGVTYQQTRATQAAGFGGQVKNGLRATRPGWWCQRSVSGSSNVSDIAASLGFAPPLASR